MDGAAVREKVREQGQRPFSLSDAAVYAGMSALVIIGFLWVLNVMGRYPLVQTRTGRGLPDDWGYFADDELAFTLALPNGWQLWQGEEAREQVNGNELYREALGPFGEQAADMRPLFVGLAPPRESGEMSMLAVVAESEALGRLSAEQMITLAEGNEQVREVEYRSDFERSGVFLSVEQAEAEPPLRCWQYVTGGENGRGTLLLSVCALAGRFGAYQETITRIVENFEALRQE
jgi:hypothetical protein